jgi:hypothetical protein
MPAFLSHYPDAQAGQFGSSDEVAETPRGPGFVGWFYEDIGAGGRNPRPVSQFVSEHRFAGEYWLIPRVGSGGDLLPPLLLWWVLLFGLSLIARYEPALWRSALDIETPLAAPLGSLLDDALEAVPHWILNALLGTPYPLPRP